MLKNRDYYYGEVTKDVPNGHITLNNHNRFKSMKGTVQEENTKKGDYEVPIKCQNPMAPYDLSQNPALMQHTGMYKALESRR